LCRRIAIIKEGRIVALDSPTALKRRISGDSVIEITPQAGQMAALQDLLRGLDGRSVVEVREPPVRCSFASDPEPSRVIALLSPI